MHSLSERIVVSCRRNWRLLRSYIGREREEDPVLHKTVCATGALATMNTGSTVLGRCSWEDDLPQERCELEPPRVAAPPHGVPAEQADTAN